MSKKYRKRKKKSVVHMQKPHVPIEPAEPLSTTTKNNHRLRWVCLAITLITIVACAVVVWAEHTRLHAREAERVEAVYKEQIAREYLPLSQTMVACGYQPDEEDPFAYTKQTASQEIRVAFDFDADTCVKNLYTFNLDLQWTLCEGEAFVSKAILEGIVNCSMYLQDGQTVVAKATTYSPNAWATAFEPLIAHSGGALRTAAENKIYTNGLSAMVQNYDLGHRVFELDFQRTTDDDLAAVHEGFVEGDDNGILMTAAEWKQYTGMGNIQPMLIGDVLDQMLINQDMFLITDTKGRDTTDFDILYRSAAQRDLSLLDRVVPQIYDREMYDSVMSVYDFPSVIFTTYDTDETPQEVVAFAAGKENIHVVTIPYSNGHYEKEYIELAGQAGLLLYMHTLNAYEDITALRKEGIHGLYTDLLLPRDFALYRHFE